MSFRHWCVMGMVTAMCCGGVVVHVFAAWGKGQLGKPEPLSAQPFQFSGGRGEGMAVDAPGGSKRLILPSIPHGLSPIHTPVDKSPAAPGPSTFQASGTRIGLSIGGQYRQITGTLASQADHMRVHQQRLERHKPFRCAQCSYRAANMHNLTQHFKDHLSPSQRPKMFYCDLCNYATGRRGRLNQHRKTHRPGERRSKPFRCGVCGHSTSDRFILALHINYHRQRAWVLPFRCGLCRYTTNSKDYLALHMRSHKPG